MSSPTTFPVLVQEALPNVVVDLSRHGTLELGLDDLIISYEDEEYACHPLRIDFRRTVTDRIRTWHRAQAHPSRIIMVAARFGWVLHVHK